MNIQTDLYFYNFLAEGNIICDLSADNQFDAINELARKLAKNIAGLDAEDVAKAVIEREKIIPTVIAPGLAVPHARLTWRICWWQWALPSKDSTLPLRECHRSML